MAICYSDQARSQQQFLGTEAKNKLGEAAAYVTMYVLK